MKYPIYVIRDIKTTYLTPTIDFNDASAMRNFSHVLKQEGSVLHSSPQDYSLWKIGVFDNETGDLENMLPELVMEGSSVPQE
uniref:Nonstructural protein n=1 Tax=Dulem virus 157 TaxID=3145634 RepID=A0AAU8B0Q4_9VIRU